MFLATHGILRSLNGVFDRTSFQYDGINDRLEMGDILDLANDGSSAYSLSCWVKTTSSSTMGIISKQRSSTPFNGYLFYFSAGKIKTAIGSSGNFATVESNSTYNDGNWHNVITTYDGSRSASGFKIYVDGAAVSTTTTSNGTPSSVANSANFCVSGRNGLNAFQLGFDGKIDEPAMFNYELTSSQVSQIYGSSIPTDISTLNPVGWWRSEKGSFYNSEWNITDLGSGSNNALSISMVEADRVTDIPT